MTNLIERFKGLFKPKPRLTIEQLALVMSSDVRQSVIKQLGLIPKHIVGIDFEQIKREVSIELDRQVSRRSLTWHLEKLNDGGVIEEIPTPEHTAWNLTPSGRKGSRLLGKIERAVEVKDR